MNTWALRVLKPNFCIDLRAFEFIFADLGGFRYHKNMVLQNVNCLTVFFHARNFSSPNGVEPKHYPDFIFATKDVFVNGRFIILTTSTRMWLRSNIALAKPQTAVT